MASEWSLPLDTPSDEIEDNSLNDLLHVNTSAQSLRLINEGSASHKIGSHGDENDVVLMNVDEVLQGSLHVSGPIPERLSALSRRQGTSQQRPQPSVSIAASSSSRRKSERSVRLKRSFSPTPETGKGNKRGPKKRKTRKSMPTQPQAENRLFDIGPDGKPFACELCQSPYICKPTRSSWRRKSQTKPKNKIPRYGYDEAKGRFLTLCNGCGIAVARRGYPKPPKVIPQTNDKEKYLEEAKQFSHNLALRLGDEDAQRLACPHFVVSKNQACGCLQRYILSEGDIEDIVHVRATHLLKLLKEAKALSTEKCYNIEEVTSKKGRQIGLGNGQKKSKRFQEFVLRNRKVLRDEFKLCERAAQRVLMYSNNFIHKKLKTEESRCRVQRIKGKAVMGLLTPIEQIPKETCCLENCIMMAVTHGRLLQEWRERVTMGQQEAKRVLAEMLTPSGGGRTNCYQFIYLVTGCSMGTISKVNDHLRRTFGDRSPPDHGLKKYWLEKGKVLESQEPEPQVSQPIETEEEEQQRDDTLSEEMPPAQLDQGVYTEIPAIDLPHTQTSESELATSSTEVIDFISSSPTKQSDPPESVMRHQLLQFHQQLLVQQANLQRQQHMIDRQLQHILTEKQTAADRQARDRSLTSNPMLTSDPRAASRPASQSLGISGPRTLLINQQGRIHPKPGEINPLKAGAFPAPGQDAHDSDDGIIRGPESMEIDDSSQDGGDSSGPWQRVNVKHSQSLLSLLTSPPKSDPMLGATHAKSQVKSSLKTSSSDPVISALVEHAPQHKKQSARPPPQQPEQPLQQRQLQPQQQQQSQQLLLQSQPQQQSQQQLLQPPPQQQLSQQQLLQPPQQPLSQQQLLQPPQQLLQPQQQQLGEPPTGSEVQVTSQAPAAQYHTITTPSGTNELIQIINPHQTHVVDSSQGLTITDITLPVLEEGSVVSIPPMTSILNTGRYPLHGNVMLLQEPMYQTDVTADGLTTLTLNTHHQGNVAPLSTHLHGNTTQSSNQTGNKPAVTNAGNNTAQTVTSIGGVFEVAPNVTITRDLKMQQTIGQQAKTSSLKTRGAQRIVSATPSTSQPHHVQGQHQPNNKVTSNVRSQQQLARKTTSQTRHPRSKAATQAKQHQPFVVKQSTLTKTSPAVAPEISVPNVTLTAPPGVTASKQTPSVVNVSNIIQQILNVSAGGAPRQTTLIHLSPSEASNVIAQLSNIASNSSNTSGAK